MARQEHQQDASRVVVSGASGLHPRLHANSLSSEPAAPYVQVVLTQTPKAKTGVIIAAPSGTAVDLLNLDPAMIHLEDIAQHLAGIARFLGARALGTRWPTTPCSG